MKELIYEVILAFRKENMGVSPTYREIRDAVGLHSVSPVAYHVKNLIAEGYLKRSPAKSRNLIPCSGNPSNE